MKKLSTTYRPYTLKDVENASRRKLFSVASFFAGGGGSSTGYRLAGGSVVLINEFVEEAVKTYSANYPSVAIIDGDLRKHTKSAASVRKLFRKHGIKVGALDILDGSPPCKDFSSSSGRKKELPRVGAQNYSDVKQKRIGTLIHDFVFMIKALRPKVAVIENVKQIAKSDVLGHAMKRLTDDGAYLFAHKILTASEYGVPQRRERLFVVIVRRDIARKAGIFSPEDLLRAFPTPSSKPIKLKNALSGLRADPQEIEQLKSDMRSFKAYPIVLQLPKSPSKPSKPKDLGIGSYFNLVRTSWSHPCPTITQTGEQRHRSGPVHPAEDRKFTIGELKRIMSLPDDFKLTGTPNQQRERIGRMVPPLLTKALAASIYKTILRKQ